MDHNTGKLFRTTLICVQPFTLAGLARSLVTDVVSAGVSWGFEGKNYVLHHI